MLKGVKAIRLKTKEEQHLMNVTIYGGGNIGTQFAVHCAEKGYAVTIYTSKPELFSYDLTIVDENKQITHQGKMACVTNDEKIAFSQADVIFVTVPAFCMKEAAEKIVDHVKSGVKIGLIPGTGGGECAFKACMDKGAVIFGLQRVPSVARLVEYGKTVCATGYRQNLYVSVLPISFGEEVRKFISELFQMHCDLTPNYLNVTLTPSNPILHTTRLRTLFKDYKEGKTYDSVPLFYEEWTDESSKLLLKCDGEVQALCRAIERFDLTSVRSLKEHYESDTPEALTRKITSIKSFKGLTTPTVKTEKGYIPDFQSRYFVADFSYGLTILKQIADFYEVATPNIDETLAWYEKVTKKAKGFSFKDYGIDSREKFEEFYSC